MKHEANQWQAQSRKDLDTAAYLLSGKRYEEASFFAQQSAEKGLKALLI